MRVIEVVHVGQKVYWQKQLLPCTVIRGLPSPQGMDKQIYIEPGTKCRIRIMRIAGIRTLFLITEMSPENYKIFFLGCMWQKLMHQKS